MDRDSYSLVIRKKTHRYRPLSPVEKQAIDEPKVKGIDPGKRDLLKAALAPDLEPFKPFDYCHHHQSAHTLESVFAVGAAPLEYPAMVTITLGVIAVQSGIRKLGELLSPEPAPEKESPEAGKERGPPR